MSCVHCERLRSQAVVAIRNYHEIGADLECSYITDDFEVTLLLSERFKKAYQERESAIAELTEHESSHILEKP